MFNSKSGTSFLIVDLPPGVAVRSAISGERKSPPAPDDRVGCAVTGLGLLSLCGAVDGQKMTVLKSAQPVI